MNRINVVHSGGNYNIYVGEDIIAEALNEILLEKDYDRIFVVSDSNVSKLFMTHFTSELAKCGREAAGMFVFPAGETSKTLETVSDMYVAFSAAKLTRASLVIALGGGVTGDMTGFAAATYLRGIDVLQVPTTLLSQIDSSIGGKTGVDLAAGKNLVGAFHQPAAVIADSRFLETLPKRYMDDGMGEAIKYGCIADAELFDSIANRTVNKAEMVYRCMKIKAHIVEEDEFESGLRMILNYGHTLGHAVEKLGGFIRFSHGESVGIGMLYAARIGSALGYDTSLEAKIRDSLEACGLPTAMDYSPDDLISVVGSDKKRRGNEISFVLLEELGKATFRRIPLEEIGALI